MPSLVRQKFPPAPISRLHETRRERIGFALAGGFLRLYAVLGATERLAAAGVVPDVLTATSSGTIIAALIAELGAREASRLMLGLADAGNRSWARCAVRPVLDPRRWWRAAKERRWPVSLQGIGCWVERQVGVKRIEDLRRPCAFAVYDATARQVRYVREGPLAWAIAAACSPAPMAPMIGADGHSYVDAAPRTNLAVQACREGLGAQLVVALDGLSNPYRDRGQTRGKALLGLRETAPRAGGKPLAPDAASYWLRMGARRFAMYDLRGARELFAHGFREAGSLVYALGERRRGLAA